MAGYEELLAVEFDENAIKTFKLNFPEVPIYEKDIKTLSEEKIIELTGLKQGQLDVLDGSPPCQGFSTVGSRSFSDPRNSLFLEFIRLLTVLKPKAFVMENVTGMIKGVMKQAFLIIIQSLRDSGYKVKAQVMNAKFYGVPQSRERIIFVGVRSDLGIEPSHPLPKMKPITFFEACKDLDFDLPEDRFVGDVVKKYSKIHNGKWSTDQKKYKIIKGNFGSAMSLQWANWNKVCGTITKSEIALSGIVHPRHTRYISLAEAKRCGSFPDNFIFTDRANGIKRIGNSVPPKLMEAIANHIKNNILNEFTQ